MGQTYTILQRNLKELWLCVNKKIIVWAVASNYGECSDDKDSLCKRTERLPKWKARSVYIGVSSRASNEGAFLVKRKTSSVAVSGNGVIISLLPSLDPWWKWKELRDNLARHQKVPWQTFTWRTLRQTSSSNNIAH